MKNLLMVLAAALLTGCAGVSKPPVRYAWVTGLKPEKVEYYKQLHANPWSAVSKQIKASHIQNYSIYLREIDGKPYLFSYLFANQALAVEYMVKMGNSLENKVYSVPDAIDREIARLKLLAMGVNIDVLTQEQIRYLNSWEEGT